VTERVRIEAIKVVQTSRADVQRYDVAALTERGLAVKYQTVDRALAAKCIAAQATREQVIARWRTSAWGDKLVALEFL
jgi:hypothetical protein